MPLIKDDKEIIPKNPTSFAPEFGAPLPSGLLRPDKLVGGSIPINVSVVDTDAATAAKYGTFFIADFPCIVIEAVERHKTAGTDAGAVTLQIEKLTSGTAPGSGVAVLNTTFNLKSTANTPVRVVAKVNSANIVLKPKDALALLTSGVLTAVAFVTVTVYIQPLFDARLQNI